MKHHESDRLNATGHCLKHGAERQSAQMSKITNDGLTRSGTGCLIAVSMAIVGVKGLTCV